MVHEYFSFLPIGAINWSSIPSGFYYIFPSTLLHILAFFWSDQNVVTLDPIG
jgi:Na+/H+ antiporter NhaC